MPDRMSDLPLASVVVCTRNRSRKLAQCGAALRAIDYPADRWELLIVDNGSTDDTLAVARSLAQGNPVRVQVVEESRPGISAARNAGVRLARGEIVAFTDDDALPSPGWLRELVEALGREDAAVAGGPVVPSFDGELPAWFSDRFLPYLSAWDRGPEVHPLTYNDYPRGANMAFRRGVFQSYGDFSLDLGRQGGSLLSCEETEICLRVERGGDRIVYVPGALVRHLTATERITPRWLARRFFAQGRSEAIVEWRHAGWRGLRRGWLRWRRMAVRARQDRGRQSDGALYARCVRSALLGYSRAVTTAPLRVARYLPARGADHEWWPWE